MNALIKRLFGYRHLRLTMYTSTGHIFLQDYWVKPGQTLKQYSVGEEFLNKGRITKIVWEQL